MFIIELEKGVWRATWSGDPGRTLVKENAKKYTTERGAKMALRICQKYPWRNGYPNAKILAA